MIFNITSAADHWPAGHVLCYAADMLRLVLKVLLGLALLLQATGSPLLAKTLVTKHACCAHGGEDTDSGPQLLAACPDCGDHCPAAMPLERTPPTDQADVAFAS